MNKLSHKLIQKVKSHVAKGGIIAYPTESCYGFGCNPFNYKAIDKVIKLKGRSKSKGLIVIAGNKRELDNLILPLSQDDYKEIANYWPGPFSLVLPVKPKVPANLTGRHKKVAVRVTKHKLVAKLCNSLKMPLVSTSANSSGFRAIKNYRECLRKFGSQVMVLPGLTNFAKRPSTIIDWETKKHLR